MDRFPLLFTPRLVLRKIKVKDFPALIKYAGNKTISDKIVNIPFPFREPDAAFRMSGIVQGFKNKRRYVFSIILKEKQEFIGEAALNLDTPKAAQLAYWIGEPFWNQGFATEAAEAVLKFGFGKLELEKIFANHHRENAASGKILTKIGMIQKNVTGDLIHFELNKTNFSG